MFVTEGIQKEGHDRGQPISKYLITFLCKLLPTGVQIWVYVCTFIQSSINAHFRTKADLEKFVKCVCGGGD